MPSLPYIQKLTYQCSKVENKVVQDCTTNLNGKLTCGLKGAHACVTIGCWRMAGGWLLPSLCANHLTDRVTHLLRGPL